MAEGDHLRQAIDATERSTGFSGVVRVDRGDDTLVEAAYGLADRRQLIPNTPTTMFGLASGAKGFTALTVMSMVADGTMTLDTTARSILRDDLPLIDDAVTIRHLLSHRSGIGDYLDESTLGEINDHVMPVPVHVLSSTESYLAVLGGFPHREKPGTTFRYNNGGYVVLALLAERAAGTPFEQLVERCVVGPASLAHTAYLRSDELRAGVATGYLDSDGLRSNVFHLPVLGSGDGGVFSTVADIAALWRAFVGGRIVAEPYRSSMIEPSGPVSDGKERYGLGFWLHPSRPTISLEGMDAGVSFRSVHDPTTATTHTVIANTSSGAWPMTKALDIALGLG